MPRLFQNKQSTRSSRGSDPTIFRESRSTPALRSSPSSDGMSHEASGEKFRETLKFIFWFRFLAN